MGTYRLFARATRTAALLPTLVAGAACATSGVVATGTPAASASAERGPRVQIWTTNQTFSADRIQTSFRLEHDAYVVVVNVGRDGYANVVFPESPDDDGFMRGGRTYRLPAFFPGFARHFRSDYQRLYTATGASDDVYDRYAGYVFVIASWRPMHLHQAEELGLWNDYRLAAHEDRLEPYVVMHRFADQLVRGSRRDYTARFARYAAFSRSFADRSAFASCSLYVPWWTFHTAGSSWIPVHGIDYYRGARRCGYGGYAFTAHPRARKPVASPPVRPVPVSPDSGGTAAPPPHPRPPRVADACGGRRSGVRGCRPERAVEGEAIIDVTREARMRARREAEGRRRLLDRERGGRTTGDAWPRRDRERASERPERERASSRATPDRDSRARSDRPRDDARTSEARREPAARSEPHRQSAPRSDAGSRSEPRGERAPKPTDRR
jgi:Domain of unknown function (DUF4384)